jgi:hypothetical protein
MKVNQMQLSPFLSLQNEEARKAAQEVFKLVTLMNLTSSEIQEVLKAVALECERFADYV